MTMLGQLVLTSPPYRNQQLFSDHYLGVTLPRHPDWFALEAQARPVFEQLKTIYRAYAPSDNEAQTEEGLVRPVLKALGHTFEVQAALATPDGTKRPDYVFYRDAAALQANKGKTLTEELLQGKAFAIGDAKYWDRPLDVAVKQSSGDPFTNKNPSYQIWFYMEQGGAEWGILTNGHLWRLYHKDTAHRLDRFYEVDLSALLEGDSVEPFLYFYAFFARSAFEPHPLGVAALLKASADYARGIGDTFKSQVYDALRHLAQGFLDYEPNGLQSDAATLKDIYDNGLIVLYRLLFVLYAEARELLPMRESILYRDRYSLHAIKHAVERDLRQGISLLPNSVTRWPELKTLFGIINAGSPPLQVATFNGGLFDPQRHPFLERNSVGDAHLQHAIDKLTRVDGQFVDYRDLAEQHLGTIYQGLLEYHLEAILPDDRWSVALLNDKGERHATGSYYTPDYIVKYMVEQTVGPLLEGAVATAPGDEEKIAAVLNINVLDPAMGSGYFLVEATEYIARFLVELGIQPQEDTGGEADLAYWRRRVAQSCIYGVDLNPLAVDLAKLSLWLITVAKDRPLSFLDHHLRPGNSLLGARIADLRAGRTSTTVKKTSSKSKRATAAGQLILFSDDAFRQSMSTAVDSMWLIEASPAQTVEDVKEQEKIYLKLHEALVGKYGTLANLVTATHFGLGIDRSQWSSLADYATGRTFILPQKQAGEYAGLLQVAEDFSNRDRYFHWELEFPEVFFDRHGEPKGDAAGFDAVIGNPPYVRQEQLAPFKEYFGATYSETYAGTADLYIYFYQQGLQLTRVGGRMSYIVTNKWMRAGYGEPLRAYFATHSVLERIVDFGHAPIFADADVFPCIVILEKPAPQQEVDEIAEHQVQVTAFPREILRTVELGRYVRDHSHSVLQGRFTNRAWSLETSTVDDLMIKIQDVGVPLAQFADVKPYYGIKTGLNEAFLIDGATKDRLIHEDGNSADIIRPYLRGQDIKRWSPEWQKLWMIVMKSSSDCSWPWTGLPEAEAEDVFQQTFPSLYQHFKPLEDRLRKRQDKGRYWWELRACAYYSAFEQPKALYQEIQFHSWFSMDNGGYFTNNKVFFLPGADLYLLAVLNSPLMWWHNWRYLPHMKDEALSPVGDLMIDLPIAVPSDDTRASVESAVGRLIAITQANREARHETIDWLRTEFDIVSPGQQLEGFSQLDLDTFVAEVRKRRPKGAGPLSPAALKVLRAGYTEQATPVRQRQGEATVLERKNTELVNVAYGLTPQETDLLWATAPPRMPGLTKDA